MRSLIATAVFAALTQAAAAQDLPALYDVTGVASDDVLNVRQNPRASADKVGELAHDATGVEVIALSDSGEWGRVNAGESNGWARMSFLTLSPGFEMGLPAFDQPLHCAGTEPFWSLSFDGAGAATYSALGEDEITMTTSPSLTAINRSLDIQAVIGASEDGLSFVASLRRMECSDGMSDRLFYYDMGLVLTDDDDARLVHGCCTLAP